MLITALKQQKQSGRINVFVDGEFAFGLAAQVVLSEGLRVGVEVSRERQAVLQRQDQGWKAREAALSLLSFRARSGAELRRRLRDKGYDDEIAAECVEALEASGLVDDAEFAALHARDRVRLRPRGKRQIVRELRSKGVDAATADAVVDTVFEDQNTSDVTLARKAAEKWRQRPGAEPARERRRLYGYLARRGFGAEAIRTVLAELLP